MLITNVASHGNNPTNKAFKIIDKTGNAVGWNPTSPSNAVVPFSIIPIQVYSYDYPIDSTVSVYLLN
jgi:hypothetical protein